MLLWMLYCLCGGMCRQSAVARSYSGFFNLHWKWSISWTIQWTWDNFSTRPLWEHTSCMDNVHVSAYLCVLVRDDFTYLKINVMSCGCSLLQWKTISWFRKVDKKAAIPRPSWDSTSSTSFLYPHTFCKPPWTVAMLRQWKQLGSCRSL